MKDTVLITLKNQSTFSEPISVLWNGATLLTEDLYLSFLNKFFSKDTVVITLKTSPPLVSLFQPL